MKKILVLLTAAIILAGCADITIGLKVTKDEVLWKNNIHKFYFLLYYKVLFHLLNYIFCGIKYCFL